MLRGGEGGGDIVGGDAHREPRHLDGPHRATTEGEEGILRPSHGTKGAVRQRPVGFRQAAENGGDEDVGDSFGGAGTGKGEGGRGARWNGGPPSPVEDKLLPDMLG
ncbi:hypothetical protein Cni_G16624 [Canna indica]|uniref:Uncharacterized protein n=1 Tax=Canna indica TaxID=4628 RepID=A0AAQ3QGZ1_9LILI|nr:hypothetical protein Cni_G16624 [Canna indica]